MSSMENKIPKLVWIRIDRAEGLRLNPSAMKKKKSSTTWQVMCSSGSKKQVTPGVDEPNGGPIFNCDVHLKVSRKHIDHPIIMLVMDSMDNQVGQAYIMPNNIPPLPRQSTVGPVSQNALENLAFSSQFLHREELEPTKKNSAPEGHLFFWCYVEEYRDMPVKKGAFGASILNLHESSSLSKSASSLISRSKLDLKNILPGKKKKKDHPALPPPAPAPSSYALVTERHMKGQPHVSSNTMDGGSLALHNVSRYNPNLDQISVSGSELSLAYHPDSREQADGRGDSDTSSIITENAVGGGHIFTPTFQLPPLSPVEHVKPQQQQQPDKSTHNIVDNVPWSSKQGSNLEINNTSRNRLPVPQFRVEPSEGSLNKSISVYLRGPPHLVTWIRECVVAVRIRDHTLAVKDTIEIPPEAEKEGNWVRILLPAERQPVSSFIELETLREGRIPSENQFVYAASISNHVIKETRVPVAQISTAPSLPASVTTPSNQIISTNNPAKPSVFNQIISQVNEKVIGGQHQRFQSEGQWTYSSDLLSDSAKKAQKKTRSLTKKDLMDHNGLLEKENRDLRARLQNQEQVVKRLYDENITLSSRLSGRDRELEGLRQTLCDLRFRLLMDGLTEYLEINPT